MKESVQLPPHLTHLLSAETTAHIVEQNENRRSWVETDNLPGILRMIDEEFEEFLEAEQLCMLGADPFVLANEAGDIGYLITRVYHHSPDTLLPHRTQHAIDYVVEVCERVGIDLEQAVVFKIWRNEIKYPQLISNNGFTPEVSRTLSKAQYALMGGDSMYYSVYEKIVQMIEQSGSE